MGSVGVMTLVWLTGSCALAGGQLPTTARQADAKSTLRVRFGFEQAGDLFTCSPGDRVTLDPAGPHAGEAAMRWEYQYHSRQWRWCTRQLKTGLFHGATAMRFSARSTRPGSIFLQLEEQNGETFYTIVSIGESWTPFSLDLSQLTADPAKRQDGTLEPDRVFKVTIADSSGVDQARGDRTMWFAEWFIDKTPRQSSQASVQNLPYTSRPFYLGFTRWPPDFSVSAIEAMYQAIGVHADLLVHHFDSGVPWPEALQDRPFAAKMMEEWSYARSHTPQGHRVFVAITPLDSSRVALARYRGNSDNQPLPAQWDTYPLNHPDVKTAFVNYARRAVEYFHPDFLAIGIEVNIALTKNPTVWGQYKELHHYVYTALKQQYPTLPIFATVALSHLQGLESGSDRQLQQAELGPWLTENDFLALSAYPYGWCSPGKPVPKNYFETALSFGKPIVIAEGGYPSHGFKALGASYQFTEDDQLYYLDLLLRAAAEHHFAFVVNWEVIDSDRLNAKFPQPAQELGSFFEYTGLLTSEGFVKRAGSLWDAYLHLPKR